MYNAVSVQPDLADYAQAIYNVYTNPIDPLTFSVAARVTYTQLINGLTQLKNTANIAPAYVATDIQGVVDNYYMQILIKIDTAGLLTASGTDSDPGSYFNATPYISMTGNHVAPSTIEGAELNDEDLHPNMTIQWQALAENGAIGITLTQFVESTKGLWIKLASVPVSVTSNTYYSRANAVLPPKTTATYAFNFTVAGSSITYWFDPYIGDSDDGH